MEGNFAVAMKLFSSHNYSLTSSVKIICIGIVHDDLAIAMLGYKVCPSSTLLFLSL